MEETLMEKYIYNGNNGLWYELRGDYYIPCLTLGEEDKRPIGRWGRKHLRYVKEYHPVRYTVLLLGGKLSSHLADIDTRAKEMYGTYPQAGRLLYLQKFVHHRNEAG